MSPVLNRLSVIGPYRVIDFVGAGGMGSVYRVVHRDTGQVAAAKVLNDTVTGGSGSERSNERFRERFVNEARIHQTLIHPNIARMFEYLEVDGLPCLIMEYVDGESLDERIRRLGILSVAEAFQIFTDLAQGVAYVHEHGIVHRDLKTNNVRITTTGQVKLLDFGIATNPDGPRLTSTGNVVGTLQSLAPEQLKTGRAESRSDIWAMGILLYEMLTGVPPFTANAPGLLGEHILMGNYTPPSERQAGIPREIDRVVAKCLRVKPEDRYQSVNAMLEDITRLSAESDGGGARTHHGLIPIWKTTWEATWRTISGQSAGLVKQISQSGELARKATKQWRMTTAIVVAFATFAFFVSSLSNSASNSQNTNGVKHVASPAAAPVRAITIRVLEGKADVYRDGTLVGVTPYELEAPLGTEVSLILRRPGCQDTPVRLRMIEGLDAVMESMRHCENR